MDAFDLRRQLLVVVQFLRVFLLYSGVHLLKLTIYVCRHMAIVGFGLGLQVLAILLKLLVLKVTQVLLVANSCFLEQLLEIHCLDFVLGFLNEGSRLYRVILSGQFTRLTFQLDSLFLTRPRLISRFFS